MDMLRLDSVKLSAISCSPSTPLDDSTDNWLAPIYTESLLSKHMENPGSRLLEVLPQSSPIVNKRSSMKFLRELLGVVSKRPICSLLNHKECTSPAHVSSSTKPQRKHNNTKQDDLLGKLVKECLSEEEEKYKAVVTELQQSFGDVNLDTDKQNSSSSNTTDSNNTDTTDTLFEEQPSADTSLSETHDFEEEVSSKASSTRIGESHCFDLDESKHTQSRFSRLTSKMSCPDFINSCMSATIISTLFDNMANYDKEYGRDQLYVETMIGKQLLGFLEYGKNQLRGFVGSPAHLEAERILVLTETRIELLQSDKKRRDKDEEAKTADVSLTNLKCYINSEEMTASSRHYYVVVLSHGNMAYATGIARQNSNGCIEFEGTYAYKSAMVSKNIRAELFCIRLNTPSRRGLRRFLNKRSVGHLTLPLMTYVGETTISIRNNSNGVFLFDHVLGNGVRADTLAARVDVRTNATSTVTKSPTFNLQQSLKESGNKKKSVQDETERIYYTYPTTKSKYT